MVEHSCNNCGSKFTDYASNHRKYCSWDCKKQASEINYQHQCNWCDKTFITKKKYSKYCSQSCAGKNATRLIVNRRGNTNRAEKHWNWQGGKPRNLRLTTVYKDWRKAVFEKDDYTCQLCGVRGGKLIADHIKPYSKYPELRLEVNNGRSLCYKCNYHVTYVTKEWRFA